MRDEFFRELTATEAEQFRKYAGETDPPNLESWFVYHPVCRAVWTSRGIVPPQYVLDAENKFRNEQEA